MTFRWGIERSPRMIETDTLLVTCPRCGAWPMATANQKGNMGAHAVMFRCIRCHAVENGRLVGTGAAGQHRAA